MPLFELQTPDGETYEVEAPDENSALEALGQMQAPQGDASRWGMFPEAMDMVTMGGASKLNAAGGGLIDASIGAIQGNGFDFQNSYNSRLQEQRADQAAYQAESPIKSGIGKGAGVALGITSLPTIGRGFAGAVKTGTAYGTTGGLLQDADSLQERGTNALVGGGTGGLLGAGLYPLAAGTGRGVAKLFGKKPPVEPVPTAADWRAKKSVLYSEAEGGIGKVKMTRNHVENLARGFNEVGKDSNKGGVLASITDDLYSGTNKTISKFNKITQDVSAGRVPPPTFGELEKMRQDLNHVVNNNVLPNGKLSADGTMSARLVDKIDEFLIDSPFKEARQAYRTMIKSEKIERAFRNAELTAGTNLTQAGMERAIQGEFKAIAKDKNFTKLFSPEEQAAIEGVVKIGFGHKAAKLFGGLAPKGALSTMFNIGMVTTNPAVGIPLGVAATASKFGSSARTISKANRVSDMVNMGGKPVSPRGLLANSKPRFLPPASLLGSDYLRSTQ